MYARMPEKGSAKPHKQTATVNPKFEASLIGVVRYLGRHAFLQRKEQLMQTSKRSSRFHRNSIDRRTIRSPDA